MIRPILLDTNVLIWALNNDRQLPRPLRRAITSPGSEVRVSVVSLWEIVVKAQIGKLSFDVPIEEVLTRIQGDTVWRVVPVLPAHIRELLALPLLHRDPFDRLLIAQARAEGMSLATSDSDIRKYQVATVAL